MSVEFFGVRGMGQIGTINTVKFDKENISDLMAHKVNPLYQNEYTIYVTCENKPKKKFTYRLKRFEN